MKDDFSLKKEIAFFCLMFLIALTLAWVSFSYPVSSSVYPRALSVFLIILSFCQLIIIYFKNKKEKRKEIEKNNENNDLTKFFSKNSIIIYIFSGCYLLGVNLFGFYVSTCLFVMSVSFYLNHKNKAVIVIWPVVLCFLVWIVFSWFLHVPTPEGLLF